MGYYSSNCIAIVMVVDLNFKLKVLTSITFADSAYQVEQRDSQAKAHPLRVRKSFD